MGTTNVERARAWCLSRCSAMPDEPGAHRISIDAHDPTDPPCDCLKSLADLLDTVAREAKVEASDAGLERLGEADRLFVKYGLGQNEDVLQWASGGQSVPVRTDDRPTCSVCGKGATNGVGQTDPSDPRVAVLVSFCDEHRPSQEVSGA